MLLAFYDKPKLKEKYLKRVQKHYDLDEIIHGVYWDNGKGCAVGCTMEQGGEVHKAMEKTLGIPESLCLLEDKLFEGMKNGDAKEFPLRFLKAIKPGADLTRVEYKFKHWLLVDKHNGVIQWAETESKKIIRHIAKLQKQASEGSMPSDEKWSAAWSAAESAAESAAWSAAESAWSAAESARSAAESAAWSEAWSVARSAHYKKMADKLIQLLEEAE